MNVHELVERDLRKAKLNLERASVRPNAPKEELEHLEELYALRKEIDRIINRRDV